MRLHDIGRNAVTIFSHVTTHRSPPLKKIGQEWIFTAHAAAANPQIPLTALLSTNSPSTGCIDDSQQNVDIAKQDMDGSQSHMQNTCLSLDHTRMP